MVKVPNWFVHLEEMEKVQLEVPFNVVVEVIVVSLEIKEEKIAKLD